MVKIHSRRCAIMEEIFNGAFNVEEAQTLRERHREFLQREENVKRAQNEVESSMSGPMNDLETEVKNRKAKITKVIVLDDETLPVLIPPCDS